MKFTKEFLSTVFPDEIKLEEVVGTDLVRLSALNSYLSEISLKLESSNLTSRAYWEGLSIDQRNRLILKLGELRSDGALADASRAESSLRGYLINAGRHDWSVSEINERVHYLMSRVEQWEDHADLGIVFSMFASVAFHWEYAAAIGAFRALRGNRLYTRIERRLLEPLLPKLHIVNFVRRRRQ